jgi:adenosine kinase
MPLYDELWNTEGRVAIPGGSALNSARATNFMLKNLGAEGRVTYFGSIGKDDKGEVLKKDLSDNGINGNFSVSDSLTGTCAVLVVDQERTLVANLSAACEYKIEHLRANMESL